MGLYEKAMPASLTWEEKLRTTKACGFDFLECSIDESEEKLARLDMPAEQRAGLVELMLKTDVHIESICLSGHRKFPLGSSDPAIRARSMEIMEKAILLARDLGVRIIQLAGYDVYYEPSTPGTRSAFAANLLRSVELAERYGIILAFETMETEFINTVNKAMYWVNQARSPYLLVYPDAGNLTNAAAAYGGDVLADLRYGEGALAAVHLKETAPGKFREIPFGAGHVDFDGIIRESCRLSVRRYLAEFWYVGQSDWYDDVRHANSFLREKFSAI